LAVRGDRRAEGERELCAMGDAAENVGHVPVRRRRGHATLIWLVVWKKRIIKTNLEVLSYTFQIELRGD
jgi:hypothetical protein